ncbi:hypothetical protein CLAFUW4_00998 [Fulvia fulva]|uniref:Anaphase-promoting complex subunit 4-like WD40 domain-containing protein n=1 Tax=Passalora fulva TaxID=5499 RepID=A0A9Q8L608_PASFU|nr:uncharacterized protein CLAFUR5_01004 [Fulvia fulva]KAK4636133.1 hypothetical protein CLAFUR4_00999 [Fulvia fulva]KAK4638287.1 hypothetical protein CLAFUR0_01000 [Fulvia fulva]UJO11449.1 hypothetical protein CLAFUR5_01004 [Fulvia fulva]WPV08337.1 hypothetical protein CLAFUW4_00998 [Fulvia fulva]WPV24118.1 hypothetical protein CLAFUW7_00818 [Fulvia fulva]
MAPPARSRPIKKNELKDLFVSKANPPVLFSESLRPSTLAPNVRSISWSPTGSMVAASVSSNIRVWNAERPDVKNSTELRDTSSKPGSHASNVEKIVFSPKHEGLLASTGVDGMLKLWDVRLPGGAASLGTGVAAHAKGGLTTKAGEHKVDNQGLFLTWHPNATELLVGRKDDVITSVDVRRTDNVLFGASTAGSTATNSYELTATDRTPTKDGKVSYNQMAFSNDASTLFSAETNGGIRIYDYPSMKKLHLLSGHTASVNAVTYSPAGTYLATGGSDGIINLFNTSTWLCDHALMDHTNAVRDLSFSFDGNYLVVGSGTADSKDGDKGINIYHVDTGDVVHKVETTNVVTYVAWHPHRYAVAYGGDPGGLKIVGGLSDSVIPAR